MSDGGGGLNFEIAILERQYSLVSQSNRVPFAHWPEQ